MKARTQDTDTESHRAERRTWTIEEAAHILGISKQHAYDAAREGKIPAIRMGRRLLVPRVALDAMLARSTESTLNDSSATVE